MIRTVRITVFAWFFTVAVLCDDVSGQSFRLSGTQFGAMRPVRVPSDTSYSVVVVEFLHHGLINAEGANLLVATNRREIVPSRVLQLGPGDFCRLAIETRPGRDVYHIYYGGDPPSGERPPWTATDGLLLETRHYEGRVAGTLDAVREAFDRAATIGAGYVESVRLGHNPFTLEPGPMLGRYTGRLEIKKSGRYGFVVSARDVGFLVIDGKELAMAKGPRTRVTPADLKTVDLSAGRHAFEFHHASAGTSPFMLVVWEFDPRGEKSAPVLIPPEAFRTGRVGRLPAGPITLASGRPSPDFTAELQGDVPLPDRPTPLIRVELKDTSPEPLRSRSTARWDFGDGQSVAGQASELSTVSHVYLRPGIYSVTLSLTRAGRTGAITHRVHVGRPILMPKDRPKLHKLDDYLPRIDAYDRSRLDAASLVQLASAYQAKAEALEARLDQAPDAKILPEEPMRYLVKAVEVGKAAFFEDSLARDGRELHALARLVGPIARERLGDSQLAARLWYEAARRIDVAELRVDCMAEAADVAINDLLNRSAAKKILDEATAKHSSRATGPAAARLHRVWGDYHATGGDGANARKAYAEAARVLGSTQREIHRVARQGAHSRSTEAFLRERQFDRAAAQLSAWRDEFPAAKVDGYLTLLYARYWAGRGLHEQAIAQADQLRTVNHDSPYADRILLLAAESEAELGRADRAGAKLKTLLHDYPGSPLVPAVKEKIVEMQQ